MAALEGQWYLLIFVWSYQEGMERVEIISRRVRAWQDWQGSQRNHWVKGVRDCKNKVLQSCCSVFQIQGIMCVTARLAVWLHNHSVLSSALTVSTDNLEKQSQPINWKSSLSVSVDRISSSLQNQKWVHSLVPCPRKRGKVPGAGGRRVNICFVVPPLSSRPLCAS